MEKKLKRRQGVESKEWKARQEAQKQEVQEKRAQFKKMRVINLMTKNLTI
jgi:hypothetical protein